MELDNTCICVLPFFCLLKIRCTYPWWCIVASITLGCQLPAAPRCLDGDNADMPGGLVPWMEATAGQPAARRCKCGPAAPCGGSGEREASFGGGTMAPPRWELVSSEPPPAKASPTLVHPASEEGFVPRHPGPSPGPPCEGLGKGRHGRAGQAG